VSVAGLALHPFAAPRDLPEALGLLAERAARNERTVLLAGGTDWFVERHLAEPETEGTLPLVVDVSRLPGLRGISLDGGTLGGAKLRIGGAKLRIGGAKLRIGGAVTYLELRKDPRVASRCPLLAAMARDVGALQIQARGTLAGNLASGSPAADGVCALAALDATVLLRSLRGARRVPLAGFYTGYRKSVLAPDELIEAVEIALPPAGAPFAWRKVGTRQAQAISKVALAGVAVVENGRCARLGLGMASVAPTVALLPAMRALGLSRPLAEVTATDLERAVLADVAPIDDIRSTAAYRRHVAVALVTRFFEGLRAG
jgi:CO/xanthine dehydrogenase FAD-binding subunit